MTTNPNGSANPHGGVISHPSSLLHTYASLVAFCTFLLIVAGGLVTSTGSGLAVPDWPLSFGQWMPPMVGGVFFEHGHRMIATGVGFLTVVLAVWATLSPVTSTEKVLAWSGVGLVIIQGLFGGLTVLLKLPSWTSVIHACLGQTFFTLMTCLAVITRDPRPGVLAQTHKIERLAWMTAGFVYLQLVLGAIYRHSGSLLHVHMAGAVLVLVHVILLWKRLRVTVLFGYGHRLLALVGLQVALGLAAWLKPYVALTTAHVATGALLLAGVTVTAVQLHRRQPR